MAKLLIADNIRASRINLTEILEFEKHTVTAVDCADDCKRLLAKNKYDLVIYNADMPEMDGLAFINFVNGKDIDVSVIMTTEKKEIDKIVRCVREGVLSFIEKPFVISQLLITVKYVLQNIDIKKECKHLHKKIIASIPEIIGSSPQINHIKKMIQRVSSCDAKVLITGSNGTGKELVARWLHELSPRKAAPLIEVNCAAIASELIDSELFGHEKGSFTSAAIQHIGKFELADGGTLFLDEIGDMSLSAQAKVLRVLQENKLSRVGGIKDINVNVRIITATNKNLRDEIQKGNFREDLYHRLNVIHIHVPTLAERSEDIPLLINHFIELISKRRDESPIKITEEAMEVLKQKPWTGNIRELQNVIERLVILCENEITPEDVEEHANY